MIVDLSERLSEREREIERERLRFDVPFLKWKEGGRERQRECEI